MWRQRRFSLTPERCLAWPLPLGARGLASPSEPILGRPSDAGLRADAALSGGIHALGKGENCCREVQTSHLLLC